MFFSLVFNDMLQMLMPASKDKIRKRYIAFRIMSDEPTSGQELHALVKGLAGQGIAASIVGERFDARMQKGLIKVSNTKALALRALLNAVKRIGNRQAMITTLGTSGTIKVASRKYLQREFTKNKTKSTKPIRRRHKNATNAAPTDGIRSGYNHVQP